MTKTLQDIPKDIKDIFLKRPGIKDDNLNSFLSNLGKLVKERLSPSEEKPAHLRMSNLGLKDRKLWFDIKRPKKREWSGLGFLFGDIIEQLIILLIKECGYKVTDEQTEVEVSGIPGHLDLCINDIPVDIKSCSKYNFSKFATGSLYKQGNDTYGYAGQLSSYKAAKNASEAAFLAVQKEYGDLAILPLTPIDSIDVKARIEQCKIILSKDTPPKEKCYEPVPDGKSGNMMLAKPCVYCEHKNECWENLRVFNYSTGLRYLTHVENTPKVEEVPISKLEGKDNLGEETADN